MSVVYVHPFDASETLGAEHRTTLAKKRAIKSETKNDRGKPSKTSLKAEDKITTMGYKRCTLRIQAKRKTILKRALTAE